MLSLLCSMCCNRYSWMGIFLSLSLYIYIYISLSFSLSLSLHTPTHTTPTNILSLHIPPHPLQDIFFGALPGGEQPPPRDHELHSLVHCRGRCVCVVCVCVFMWLPSSLVLSHTHALTMHNTLVCIDLKREVKIDITTCLLGVLSLMSPPHFPLFLKACKTDREIRVCVYVWCVCVCVCVCVSLSRSHTLYI